MTRVPPLIPLLLLVAGTLASAEGTSRGVRVVDASGQEVGGYSGGAALVIGCSRYQNPAWSRLEGVPADVQAVSTALAEAGFAVSQLTDPDGAQLAAGLKDFVLWVGDVVDRRLVVYFAGHGHTVKLDGQREMGYVVPVDAPDPRRDLGGFRKVALDMRTVENLAEQILSRHALFVFDACFAGSLFKLRAQAEPPPAVSAKLMKPVRQFMTAGSAQQAVPDESVFRRYFVRGIGGEADANRDGWVTGTELGEFLVVNTGNDTRNAQTPQIGKIRNPDLNEGDFVFRVAVPGAAGGATVPQAKGFDLGDLERQAQQQSAQQEKSKTYQHEMHTAFTRTQALASQGAAADLQRQAWQRFLEAFAADDPLSPEDEKMRAAARQAMEAVAAAGVVVTPAIDGPGRPAWASGAGQDRYGRWAELTVDGVVQRLRWIAPGSFQMGSPASEAERGTKETAHTVRLTRGYWLADTECTQALWQTVMGNNPSHFTGDGRLPVEQVSWEECQQFLTRLNGKTSGLQARLPSEAQWEYACRAGTTTPFSWGGTITPDQVNYDGDNPYAGAAKGVYRKKTVPVGSFSCNPWGLFDMHGNVREWCGDWYGDYPTGSVTDPIGPAAGSIRVNRGGSWNANARYCRSAFRNGDGPGYQYHWLGFRFCAQSTSPGGGAP